MLSVDNMRMCLSTAGCKIFKFSDRNTSGLALKMDVIKAGCAVFINLSHCQMVVIVEAPRRTTESFLAGTIFKDTHTHLVETL